MRRVLPAVILGHIECAGIYGTAAGRIQRAGGFVPAIYFPVPPCCARALQGNTSLCSPRALRSVLGICGQLMCGSLYVSIWMPPCGSACCYGWIPSLDRNSGLDKTQEVVTAPSSLVSPFSTGVGGTVMASSFMVETTRERWWDQTGLIHQTQAQL